MAKDSIPLTHERLKQVLDYNPETGVFTWISRTARRTKIGEPAGCRCDGYIRIEIDYKSYWGQRLAWLYVHGRWPSVIIDHINGNRSDNRITNLREATHKQNCQNASRYSSNKFGFKGVSLRRETGKFRSCIRIDKRTKHLGEFNTPEEAYDAYCKAAVKYFGDFSRFE